MASGISFNSLLAKAEKNTSNAKKLLEEKNKCEKKTQEQKKANAITKESALAFLKQRDKERREKEAKEISEKKISNTLNNKPSTVSSSSTSKSVSSNILKNNSTSTNKDVTSNKISSTNLVNKDKKKGISTANSVSKSSDNISKKQKPISNSIQIPTKASESNKKSSNNNNSNNNKNKTSDLLVKKTPVTLESMLKLADNVQKEKELKTSGKQIKPTSSSAEAKSISNIIEKDKQHLLKKLQTNVIKNHANDNKHPEKLLNKSSEQPVKPKPTITPETQPKNFISKLRPDQIEKLKQRETAIKNKSTSNLGTVIKNNTSENKPKSLSNISKSTSSIKNESSNQQSAPKCISAWDRAVATVKKKPLPNVNIKNAKKLESDEMYVSEYDEDEMDSDMDSFIDDDECSEDEEEAHIEIRKMFKYDPSRYKHIDDNDIDDMETDFHSQLQEEKRSLKLGLQEDLIEERKELERQQRKELKRSGDLNLKGSAKTKKTKT